jgi:hypothetical protein
MKKLIKVAKTTDAVEASVDSRERGDGKFWCRRFKDYGSNYEHYYFAEFLRGEWTKYKLTAGVYELCRTIEKNGEVVEADRFFLFVDRDLQYRFFHKKSELRSYIDKIKATECTAASDGDEEAVVPF